ncbi:MAG: hypothetical protein PHQ59_03190 [Candidatus Daviesbacteria bacterium]|nr:hypothetical protein [Candidatus Daviesbacteria bacterium]
MSQPDFDPYEFEQFKIEIDEEIDFLDNNMYLKIDRLASKTLQELVEQGYTSRQVVIKGETPEIGASIYRQIEILRRESGSAGTILSFSLFSFDQMSGGGEDFYADVIELDAESLETELQETSKRLGLPIDKRKILPIVIR